MTLTIDDAILLVKKQMAETRGEGKDAYRSEPPTTPGLARWHYGRCELAALLSAIYGVDVRPSALLD